jgi:gliding motility-associated protein GldC|tara:strand:- start:153 stop:491 length:339 start_codon:yes stop_codon:yes gene_type:complete
MNKKSDASIEINVKLDENKIPEKINWSASDGGVENEEAKAFLMSIWDADKMETLKIDLWVKDMSIDHMKIFFHQSLVAMTETFFRSTKDEKMTSTLNDFCDYFAKKMELKKE